MQLRPEGHKIIVEAEKTEEVSKGGIIIPKTSQESEQIRMNFGRVIAIGPTVDLNFEWLESETPVEGRLRKLQIGDEIWFSRYGGDKNIRVKDNDVRIINDNDVLALVN